MSKRDIDFDAAIELHKLLNELPKAATVFKRYSDHRSVSDVVTAADPDGLAQLILFSGRLRNMRVPKAWRRRARLFHDAAAYALATHSRNPLDSLAEVKR